MGSQANAFYGEPSFRKAEPTPTRYLAVSAMDGMPTLDTKHSNLFTQTLPFNYTLVRGTFLAQTIFRVTCPHPHSGQGNRRDTRAFLFYVFKNNQLC